MEYKIDVVTVSNEFVGSAVLRVRVKLLILFNKISH